MIQSETRISRFFDLYADETARFDVPAIASRFTDPFLSAGPSGTQIVHVVDFAAALPKKKALFSQLGSQPALLVEVVETHLDSRYVLARTISRMSFIPDNIPAQKVDAGSTFLIDTGQPDTDPKDFTILLYLTHQDLMQVLRERGILHS